MQAELEGVDGGWVSLDADPYLRCVLDAATPPPPVGQLARLVVVAHGRPLTRTYRAH